MLQEGAVPETRRLHGLVEQLVIFLGGCDDLERQRQGVPALGAGHGGLPARAHAADKVEQFLLQRVCGDDRNLPYHRHRHVFQGIYREPELAAAFLVEVNGQTFAGLEDAHAAFHHRGNPAGGDVGGAAVLKDEMRVHDVGVRGDDRPAHCAEARNRRLHERENDVQIVNHQVDDHIHIRAAVGEHAYALGFDEKRQVQAGLDGPYGRVEAFDQAHLQDAAMVRREPDQRVRLGQRGGDGLFHHHVHAVLQAEAAHLEVTGGGGGHGDGVHLARQFAVIGKGGGAGFPGCTRRLGGVQISDSNQLDALHGSVFLGMIAAQMTHANDTDANGFCHDSST